MPENLAAFDFTFSGFLSGLIFSTIGLWLFQKGRKESEIKIVIVGLALMLYSYFTHGPVLDWGVGALICGVAYYLSA